ncbi:Hypothetical protein D9617_13g100190 [Elsinoe fawcettii]|nr:Hypothetical protein D9617_13g100190 [Elsinoe fawcettii]
MEKRNARYSTGRVDSLNVVVAQVSNDEDTADTADRILEGFPYVQLALIVGTSQSLLDSRRQVSPGDVVIGAPRDCKPAVVSWSRSFGGGSAKILQQCPPDILSQATNELTGRLQSREDHFDDLLGKLLRHQTNDIRVEHSRPLPRAGSTRKEAPVQNVVGLPSRNSSFHERIWPLSKHEITSQVPNIEMERSETRMTVPGDWLVQVHHGVIAASVEAAQDPAIRSRLSSNGTICVLSRMTTYLRYFPSIMICGVTGDAADVKFEDDENDQRHRYAAATAAAYTRELLGIIQLQNSDLISAGSLRREAAWEFERLNDDLRKVQDRGFDIASLETMNHWDGSLGRLKEQQTSRVLDTIRRIGVEDIWCPLSNQIGKSNQGIKTACLLFRSDLDQVFWDWVMDIPSSIGSDQDEVEQNLLERLLNSLVLCDHLSGFSVKPCREYIEQRWKTEQLGSFVARLLVKTYYRTRATSAELLSRSKGLEGIVYGWRYKDHFCMIGKNLAIDTVEKLWAITRFLCQSVRLNNSMDHQGLHKSRTGVFEVGGSSACWTTLFSSAIVIEDARTDETHADGLELDFRLMTELAAVETYHWVESSKGRAGYILLGFFTALVPVKSDDEQIFWHFESSSASPLVPAQLECLSQQWLASDDHEMLSSKRSILGLWPEANVCLGTKSHSSDIGRSGLPSRERTLHTAGYEGALAFGMTGPPVQGILQGTRTFKYYSNIQRFSREASYVGALDFAAQQVALVFDVKAQIGWLVPQISVLLQLCHVYHAFVTEGQSGQADPIPWAKVSTNGAAAAKEAFLDAGDT